MTIEFKRFGRLPGRPSALIRIGVRDMRATISMGVKINMELWALRKPDSQGQLTCIACMAGSVMINSLEDSEILPPTFSLDPTDFKPEYRAIMAINYFRLGLMKDGFGQLNIPVPRDLQEVPVEPFDPEDPEYFLGHMEYIADELERKGY